MPLVTSFCGSLSICWYYDWSYLSLSFWSSKQAVNSITQLDYFCLLPNINNKQIVVSPIREKYDMNGELSIIFGFTTTRRRWEESTVYYFGVASRRQGPTILMTKGGGKLSPPLSPQRERLGESKPCLIALEREFRREQTKSYSLRERGQERAKQVFFTRRAVHVHVYQFR